MSVMFDECRNLPEISVQRGLTDLLWQVCDISSQAAYPCAPLDSLAINLGSLAILPPQHVGTTVSTVRRGSESHSECSDDTLQYDDNKDHDVTIDDEDDDDSVLYDDDATDEMDQCDIYTMDFDDLVDFAMDNPEQFLQQYESGKNTRTRSELSRSAKPRSRPRVP